uniref:Uncharacterized protein n=1 Tax=Entomoneis paludosa TaxID=265537 RepID=A0A7S3DPL2_9STRA|mmetsp:Transcript_25845/g.53885  ORF Transcript_25845/g.53885 Transcript_25845/m.53885 type:complete len:595 (+) Transcript_25845:293-2077(+)
MGRRKLVISLPLLCAAFVVGSTIWHAAFAPFHFNQPITRSALEKPNAKLAGNTRGGGKNTDVKKGGVARKESEVFTVEIYVRYDNYASDIEWSLKGADGGNVLSHYKANETDNGQEQVVDVLVNTGKFTFEVKDAYGDGLCCRVKDYEGHYRLSVNGKVIATGGEFADTTGPISFQTYSSGNVKSLETANLGLQPSCLELHPNNFDICLYLTTRAERFGNDWLPAFTSAKKKWETIVVGSTSPPVEFKEDLWQRPKTLSGIYITGEAAPIDGVGKILGSSGPRTMITTPEQNPVNHNRHFKQTLTGEMTFDSDDIAKMLLDGTYKDVIVHEMGHVLGLGTMWEYNGLHSGRENDPVYRGINAQREYTNYGFPGKLEVEVDHGEGTAGGHWDEECLRSEIMTGMADPVMQFSKITVGGMEDLGYKVDYTAADQYSIPLDAACGQQDPKNPIKRVRQLSGQRPRRLSELARTAAISYAEVEMQKSRERHERLSLPKNVIFIGDQVRHVLIEEDGHIYSVSVRGGSQQKESENEDKAPSIEENPKSIVAISKSKSQQSRPELVHAQVHDASSKQKDREASSTLSKSESRPLKISGFL